MLTVNNKDHPFHEGMTIRTLLDEKGFVFYRIIVKLNGKVVDDARFAETSLHDGDNVKAIHLCAGG
jgi:thiamine biosynthesis protein ThiS